MAEHVGARTEKAMRKFLESVLRLETGAERGVIRVKKGKWNDVASDLMGRKVVVLLHESFEKARSVYGNVVLPEADWNETRHIMSSDSTIFVILPATVFYNSLSTDARNRYDTLVNRYGVPPLVATSPTNILSSPRLYFPGIPESPLGSFMHVSTMDRYAVLHPDTARFYLESPQIIALVFGNHRRPAHFETHFLEAISSESQQSIVPLYANIHNWTHLAEHVGLQAEGLDEWETQYVMYRFGNVGADTWVYNQSTNGSLAEWTDKMVKRAGAVETIAGGLYELNETNWDALFRYDPRGILLCVCTRGSSTCPKFKSTFAFTAKKLAKHATRMVVTWFDVIEKLPTWPKMEVNTVPGVYWIAPGQDAVPYEGMLTSRSIARFARLMADGQGTGVDWKDVGFGYMFVSGVVLVIIGVLGGRIRKPRKREHVT